MNEKNVKNRIAQKKFRERREKYIKDLEEEIKSLKFTINQLNFENQLLKFDLDSYLYKPLFSALKAIKIYFLSRLRS